jgi:UDP-GlcNAc3NAcA epimerase
MNSNPIKIVTVVGARPQFIKAAVVSRQIAQKADMEELIVHTGQHFDRNMSDLFFEELALPRPRYQLDINCLGHGAMTGRMMEELEKLLLQEQPDWVLVYGDTNSTLAGALAAKKLHIKVAHVEAGLRSFNMDMPEEVNRILTDRISDVLFCPTFTAVQNLHKEGFADFNIPIIQCGDVMQDAALFYAARAKKPEATLPETFILCTVHRAENIENTARLNAIFDTLNDIAGETPVVIPLHPHTRRKLEAIQYNFAESRLTFIEPVGYLEMVWLLQQCQFVMTDSGGLQKEAYFFRKLCLTLREETEWIELVENGINNLVGANPRAIKSGVAALLCQSFPADALNLYGDGDAARKILEEIRRVSL